MEQWRRLVSELIHVCYRMSDVVSPVVQSSSPEGLIPMDSDSGNPSRNVLPYSEAPGQIQSFLTCSDIWTETSAGLQRILLEIQPRDTNDFFTSARELDTHRRDGDTQNQTSHTPNTGE